MTSDWQGLDPLVRALRAIAVVAFLMLLIVVVLDPARADNELSLLLVGAILFALGYPLAMRLPTMFGRTDPKDGDEPRHD